MKTKEKIIKKTRKQLKKFNKDFLVNWQDTKTNIL